MSLSENLRNAREQCGMTQEELSECLSISRVNISNFEKGVKIPTLANLVVIADTLDCSIDELLDRKKFADQNLEN